MIWKRLFAIALLPLAALGADTLVSLDRGSNYEMSRPKDCDCWSARIYITKAKGFEKKSVTATVLGAAIGTQSSTEFASQFTNPVPVQVSGELAAFDIATRPGVLMPHAVFDIILLFRSGEAQQRQTVQLTIPAAALRQPPTLQIIRVVPFFGLTDESSTPSLVLAATEKSRSPAQVVIALQDHFSDIEKEYGGQLVFDPKTPVPQDGSASYTYSLNGEFPLGVAKANLSVSSRQLEAPLTVPVEVKTRRAKAALWCLIIVGLALGFLLRTVLKKQVQYNELKQQAIDVMRQLQEPFEKAADATYREDLKQAMDDLDAAIRAASRRRQELLTDSINLAKSRLTGAQTGLQSRVTAAKARLEEFTTLTTTGWRVSALVTSKLQEAALPLPALNVALTHNDAARVDGVLTTQTTRLRSFLAEAAPKWKLAYGDVLHQMEALLALLIDPARTTLKSALDERHKVLDPFEPPGPDSKVSDLQAAIKTIDTLTAAGAAMLEASALGVKSTWSAINRRLQNLSHRHLGDWPATEQPTHSYASDLSNAAMQLTGGMRIDIGDAAGRLRVRWARALVALVPEEHRAEVEDLTGKGEYIEAAQKILELHNHKPEPRPKDKPMGGIYRSMIRAPSGFELEQEEIEAAGFFADLNLQAAGPPERWLDASGAQPPIAVSTLRRTMYLTLFELFAARFIQWIISAIGLAIVGYLLFADKWVGTGPEMLTAFFWGFTTDIGLDALVAAASKSKASA